jgi:hypothetical protein
MSKPTMTGSDQMIVGLARRLLRLAACAAAAAGLAALPMTLTPPGYKVGKPAFAKRDGESDHHNAPCATGSTCANGKTGATGASAPAAGPSAPTGGTPG